MNKARENMWRHPEILLSLRFKTAICTTLKCYRPAPPPSDKALFSI